MGLRAKFNLAILVAFVLGLLLEGALAYRITIATARSEVIREAQVMLSQATAISDYTDQQVAPLLAEQLTVRFLPQTIPFWAAKTNFWNLKRSFPDRSFKEAALNPTNPADRASDWEVPIIEAFRHDPTLTHLVTTRDTPMGKVLSIARPVRVSEQSCLQCHSTPAEAPPTLVDLYGTEHGFGWQVGETVGAEIVSVPMKPGQVRALRAFATFLAGMTVVFVLIAVLLNVLLHYMIVRPVRQ